LEFKLIDRIRHFRAGLLLALSSAVLFLPISYWLPLPEYFGTLASEEYVDYQLALRSIVAIYLVVLILNLVTAGLASTKLDNRVKLWLSFAPAVILLLAPFLLVIPTALKFPDRNYFEVFQAMYRLLRFSSPLLLTIALLSTAISVGLNVRAALIFRSATAPGGVPANIRNRYFIYGGVMLLVFAIIVPVGAYNGSLRSLDRSACNTYAALEIPKLDEDVPKFLSDIRVIGESAGNRSIRDNFIKFSDLSRQYFSLLSSEPENSLTLKQYEVVVAETKQSIVDYCSEYGVK
jgi:hypothetical protein